MRAVLTSRSVASFDEASASEAITKSSHPQSRPVLPCVLCVRADAEPERVPACLAMTRGGRLAAGVATHAAGRVPTRAGCRERGCRLRLNRLLRSTPLADPSTSYRSSITRRAWPIAPTVRGAEQRARASDAARRRTRAPPLSSRRGPRSVAVAPGNHA